MTVHLVSDTSRMLGIRGVGARRGLRKHPDQRPHLTQGKTIVKEGKRLSTAELRLEVVSQTNPRPDLPASPLNLTMCQNDPQGHVTGCWGPPPLPVQLTPSPETTDCVKATLPCIHNTCPLNFESGKGQLHPHESELVCVSPSPLPCPLALWKRASRRRSLLSQPAT